MDAQTGILNPVGMFGAKVEVDVHVVHGHGNRLKNSMAVVKGLQLEVEEVVFNGLASSLALLSNEQKELGSLVIDMGGGTTDYAVYCDGIIKHTGVLAVGGDHLSNDLAYGLKVPLGRAEQLKLDHASALMQPEAKGRTIELPGQLGLPFKTVNLEHLHRITSLRLEEIFELIEREISPLGWLERLRAGVFLCGGGARIPHIQSLAESIFQLPAFPGKTNSISGLKSALDQPEFATAIGLVRFGSLQQKRKKQRRPRRRLQANAGRDVQKVTMTTPLETTAGAPVEKSGEAALRKTISIKVCGVGGAGCNAAGFIAQTKFDSVGFLLLNTDAQALAASPLPDKWVLGRQRTRGLGTGGDPEQGRAAAEDDAARLASFCAGADIIFILAGLGGGTGTGAAPVLARVARESGALVLAMVTLPFDFEGARRQRQAGTGLQQLKAAADAVICLPNQKLFKMLDENTSVLETFVIGHKLMADGLRGIWRLLTQTGLINVDFADLCSVTRGRHVASSFATAEAGGEKRGEQIIEKLLAHPLLDGGQVLNESDAVLVSLAGGPDLAMSEVNKIMEPLQRQCENAHFIFGAVIDEAFAGRLSVTLIASGPRAAPKPRPAAQPRPLAAERPRHAIPRPVRHAASALPFRRASAGDVQRKEGAALHPSNRPIPPQIRPPAEGTARWKLSSKAVSTKASQPSATARTWTCPPTSAKAWR